MAQSPRAQHVGRSTAKILPGPTPPANLEAEQAVLGGIMRAAQAGDTDAVRGAAEILTPGDFYAERHRHIFTAMEAVHASGRLPDLLTVTDTLAQTHVLDAAGGASYVTSLLDATFGVSTLPQHLRIVKRDSLKRHLAEGGLALYEGASNGQPVEGLVAFAGQMADAARTWEFDSSTSKESSLRNRIQTATELLADPGSAQSWFPLWGQGGFVGPGLLTLVSGHSKVAGKSTSLAVAIRDLIRATPERRVLVLSEEPRSVWVRRLTAWHLDAPALSFRFADGTSWPRLLHEIDGLPLDLVLVDTLRSFAAIQDESDASKVVEAVQPLVLLTRRKHVATILTHHLRKADADSGLAHSGSTALVALADVAIEMRLESDHSPNRRVLRAVSRFEETLRALTIELRGADIVSLGAPEAVTLNEVAARVQALLRADQGMSQDAIRKDLDDPRPSPEQTFRALRTLFSEGKAHRSGEGVRGDPYLWWAKDSILLRTPLRVEESNSRE